MPFSTAIRAGRLRHRIQIVKPKLTQDATGGTVIDDDSLVASVWAAIEPLTGRELYAAQQMVSEVTHKITIRWMDGIKSNMNVRFGGREFQIQSIQNPDERHKVLILLSIERDDSARESGAPLI
jgi:SPP1 family predicted phage head-tail adaptor